MTFFLGRDPEIELYSIFSDHFSIDFRLDADIYRPYAIASSIHWEVTHSISDQQSYIDQLIRNKTKLALWVASEGVLPSSKERLKLTDRLAAAGLNIDRRGRLFPDAPILPRTSQSDFLKFLRGYKFYFALENQWHCRDYITEKTWTNGLRAETVPVVWGPKKEEYEAVLPPKSAIFADNFASEADLVEYLNYLDRNDTAYGEYFHWRTLKGMEMPNSGRQSGVCQLCRMLHGIHVDNHVFNAEKYSDIEPFSVQQKPRIIGSLADEFFGTENDDCQ